MGVSGAMFWFSMALAWEYVQKYIALEGATPTMFGPRPLNNAFVPSVWTMCLEKVNLHKQTLLSPTGDNFMT